MQLKTLSLQNNIIYVAFTILVLKLISINSYGFILLVLLIKIKPKYLLIGLSLFLIAQKDISTMESCVIIDIDEYSLCRAKTDIYLKGGFSVGDIVSIEGVFNEPSESSSPFTFNYRNYLKGKNIYYQIYEPHLEIIGHKDSIFSIRDFVKQKIETYPLLSKKYLSALIVGDKQYFSNDELTNISELGISHLLAISGLHVGLLCMGLEKIIKTKNKEYYIIVVILAYMLIAGFSPSITRAGSMYIMSVVLRRWHFSNLDALSIVFIGYFLMNHNVIYDIGFQLSFLVTLSIILTKPKGLLEVSIVAQLATMPLVLNMYNQFNLITIFINVYFIILMSYFVLPLSFLNLVVNIDKLYLIVVSIFDKIIVHTSNFNMIINIQNIHPLLIVVYYIALIKKPVISVLLIVIVLFLPAKEGVYFLDVGQGDSTLVIDEFVTLIDTGGKREQEITLRNVIPVLRSIGVNEIDYLVLTHKHFDHYGGYLEILDEFNVKNIVIGEYSDFDLNVQSKIIKVAKDSTFGNIIVLDPEKYHNSVNNQSLVLDIDYYGLSILTLADSELKRSYGEYDVMKLGHHGSMTSLTTNMFAETAPEVVIISVGRNSYGLPSQEALDIVKEAVIYQTNIHNTIIMHEVSEGFISTKKYKNKYLGNR